MAQLAQAEGPPSRELCWRRPDAVTRLPGQGPMRPGGVANEKLTAKQIAAFVDDLQATEGTTRGGPSKKRRNFKAEGTELRALLGRLSPPEPVPPPQRSASLKGRQDRCAKGSIAR
uniref:Uncharacterized protein n=1 Tax=Achromobacter xylosoxidans (strain A8) TaxID=762376 RepID=Q5GR79_ACHXA|nr:hypothetical protein [Achromobacter xylosoxidans A8]